MLPDDSVTAPAAAMSSQRGTATAAVADQGAAATLAAAVSLELVAG